MWNEILSALLGAVVVMIIGWIKPEWMIGWMFKIIETRMKRKQANDVENMLGVLFFNFGYYALNRIPDTPEIRAQVEKINNEVKELKKLLDAEWRQTAQ